MKRRRRNERVFVRVTEKEKLQLEKLASERDVPTSQIVREAVKAVVANAAK